MLNVSFSDFKSLRFIIIVGFASFYFTHPHTATVSLCICNSHVTMVMTVLYITIPMLCVPFFPIHIMQKYLNYYTLVHSFEMKIIIFAFGKYKFIIILNKNMKNEFIPRTRTKLE